MNKKITIAFGVMFAIILCLQVTLMLKIDRVYEDMISSENFASVRIDVITSHLYELRDMIKELSEQE